MAAEVVDDGRGIPVDKHPDPKMKGLTAAEVVLTVLHAGGKFGGGGYKVSGGLHGVGVSVVNALSTRVEVEIDRDGDRHYMDFEKGGKLKTKLNVTGKAPARPHRHHRHASGPTPPSSRTPTFRAQTLLERFQMMAFLNKGLEIRFQDQRPDAISPEPVVYKYAGGINDFVKHLNDSKEPLFSKVGYFEQVEPEQEVEIAFQWNTGFNADGLHSFANGIATIEGGMHDEGFRKSLTNVVNKYARAKGLLKEKEENLQGEDIREGLTAIISVRLQEPAVRGPDQGQARQRLDALAGREGHQREAGRLVRGEPHRGPQGRQQGHQRLPGPPRRPQRP